MLTQSGILVMPGGATAPSLDDIALGLGRMPRFAGQTRGWWSVLHHSLVVERIVASRGDAGLLGLAPADVRERVRLRRLAALFHDAHEAITGDVPSPWKPAMLKNWQAWLDARIAERYGIVFGLSRVETQHADHVALLAEGYLVGPPGFSDLEGLPSTAGVEAVEYIRTLYPSPEDTISPTGRAVLAFKTLARELLHARTEGGAVE